MYRILVAGICLIQFLIGCNATEAPSNTSASQPQGLAQHDEGKHSSGEVTLDTLSDPQFNYQVSEGRLIVHLSAGSHGLLLIRKTPYGKANFDESDRTKEVESDRSAYQAWQSCINRMRADLQTSAEVHDALLETTEKLELAYEADRGHLGILRDLITTYTQLLRFEGRSHLGSNVCVLVNRRLHEFESQNAPLELSDRQWVTHIRANLHFQMHQYPKAAQLQDDVTQAALQIIGQSRFLSLPADHEAQFTIRPYQTVGSIQESQQLVHDEYHFLVSFSSDTSPDTLRVYCLSRHGKSDSVRWYLDSYFLNRSTLIKPYGKVHPDFKTVMKDVRDDVTRSLGN